MTKIQAGLGSRHDAAFVTCAITDANNLLHHGTLWKGVFAVLFLHTGLLNKNPCTYPPILQAGGTHHPIMHHN